MISPQEHYYMQSDVAPIIHCLCGLLQKFIKRNIMCRYVPVNHEWDHPGQPPYPLVLQALTSRDREAGILPLSDRIMPRESASVALRNVGGVTMADNLEVLNTAVSLLIRATLLAARFMPTASRPPRSPCCETPASWLDTGAVCSYRRIGRRGHRDGREHLPSPQHRGNGFVSDFVLRA
jgi:hypothetical protein